jgi:hypothetical protein
MKKFALVKVLPGRTYDSDNKVGDVGMVIRIDPNAKWCVKVKNNKRPNSNSNWENIKFLKTIRK